MTRGGPGIAEPRTQDPGEPIMSQRSLLQTYALWISPLIVLVVSGLAVWSAYAERIDRRQADHLQREIGLYKEVRQLIRSGAGDRR